jgi:hypothetical protein
LQSSFLSGSAAAPQSSPPVAAELQALADAFVSLKVGLKETCVVFAVELSKQGVVAVEDFSEVTEADARDMMARAGMSKLQQNRVIQAEAERKSAAAAAAAAAYQTVCIPREHPLPKGPHKQAEAAAAAAAAAAEPRPPRSPVVVSPVVVRYDIDSPPHAQNVPPPSSCAPSLDDGIVEHRLHELLKCLIGWLVSEKTHLLKSIYTHNLDQELMLIDIELFLSDEHKLRG